MRRLNTSAQSVEPAGINPVCDIHMLCCGGEIVALCHGRLAWGFVGLLLFAPGVPIRDLLLCQRQKIPGQIDPDEPETHILPMAKLRQPGRITPDGFPNLPGQEEFFRGMSLRSNAIERCC